MKLTTRGEIVLATLGTLFFIACLGFLGWIEGGAS